MSQLSYHLRRVLDLESFLSRFGKVRHIGVNSQGVDNWACKCPAHETHHESAVVGVSRDGRYLVHCHAGCSEADIMAAVGLSVSDLYPDGAMADRISPIQRPLSTRVDDAVLEIAKHTRDSGGRLSKADLARERQAWLAAKKDRSWPRGAGNGG
jgi:predicted protein tyrosine phosphatase